MNSKPYNSRLSSLIALLFCCLAMRSPVTLAVLNPGIQGRNVTVLCNSHLISSGALVGDTLPNGYDEEGAELNNIQFVADWVVPFECCLHDTAGIYFREFEGFDEGGQRYSAFDTLVFLRPPIIDTILCQFETIGDSLISQDGTYQENINSHCQQLYRVRIVERSELIIDVDRDALCGPHDSISLEANQYFDSYEWSTGEVTRTIRVGSEGRFFATAVDSNACLSSSDTVQITKYHSFEDQEICAVTFDRELGKNVILFDKPDITGVASYVIFADKLGIFKAIDTVSVDSLAIVIHEESRPDVQSHSYRIGIIDSCGIYRESPSEAAAHKSILLQSTFGTNSEINLSWNSYEGREIGNYQIWLSRESKEDTLIDEVSFNNSSYIWRDPPSGSLQFHIKGVFSDTCLVEFSNSGRSIYQSIITEVSSNVSKQILTRQRYFGYENVTISPNPTAGLIRVDGFEHISKLSVKIFNYGGRQVMCLENPGMEIDCAHLPRGHYLVQIISDMRFATLPLVKM